MILRFKSDSSEPRYIAFNSKLQTYTTDPEQVKQGQVITVACNYFDQIAAEIDFNGFDYADNLHTPAEVEEVPTF